MAAVCTCTHTNAARTVHKCGGAAHRLRPEDARFAVAAQLSADGLAGRDRAASAPVRRRQLPMIRLLLAGRSLAAVAGVMTGSGTRWVREVVARALRRRNRPGRGT